MKIRKTFRAIVLLVLALSYSPLFAQLTDDSQSKYMVFFADKNGVEFDPFTYFDVKTIERRVKFNIPLDDITDYPVREDYVSTVSELVNGTTHASRWFNALAVIASPNQIEEVKNLPFVMEVEELNSQAILAGTSDEGFNRKLSEYHQELLEGQTAVMGAEDFQKAGIDGKGVRVAIFDAGFPTVDVNPAFEHIRKDNRILMTHDFVRNKDNVFKASSHGTSVMSCIAGKVGDTLIGLATGAEFILARTEHATFEPFSEEENWLAAAEWADKNGADIINSSLGYTKHRYFPEDMNGKKSFVSRAANFAARKGILVVNAAGNEGGGGWKYVGTPADADSVLSVGGIDHDTHFHTSFSSYGPTADGRMKPNVCAYGHVIASGKSGLEKTQGTSFASPLAAGFAACAWQTNRNLSNMELFKEIEKSGSLYPYFDYAHGFGVPQASYFVNEATMPKATFTIDVNEDEVKVMIEDEYMPIETDEMHFEGEEVDLKRMAKIGPNPKLFYSIEAEDGSIEKYYVVSVNQKDVLVFMKYEFRPGQKLNVSYLRYTSTYEF